MNKQEFGFLRLPLKRAGFFVLLVLGLPIYILSLVRYVSVLRGIFSELQGLHLPSIDSIVVFDL